MKRILISGLIASLPWFGAFADHSAPVGSVGLLLAYTQDLEQAVRYSGLRYEVQYTVYRFHSDVRRLADCVRRGPWVHDDHASVPGCPSSCSRELYEARASFQQAERYLYDTQWDFPHVYRAYLNVRQALHAISITGGGHPFPGPGPGPGPSLLRCVAVDAGWEEHFGGHLGYGRTIYEAQRMALRECERHHGRCRIQSCR